MTLYLSTTLGDRPVTWKIESHLTTIGRSSSCEIRVADPSVSRRHAEITRQGDRFFLRDLGSHNGTRVNGKDACEPLEIRPGDRIGAGGMTLHVTADAPSRPVVVAEGTGVDTSVQLRADHLVEAHTRGEQKSESLVTLLVTAGQLLVLPRPLTETCDEILEIVARAVPGSRHVLALREEGSTELRQVAARYCGGVPGRPLALSHSIIDRVLDECTSVLTADASEDPRFRTHESVVRLGVHSAMAVPLFDNRQVLGLLYVDSQDVGIAFDSRKLEVLTLLANMAAVKISNAHLLEAEHARLRLAHELATAAEIQRGLLPPAPSVEGWQVDAHLETCYEVGGDLYDCRLRNDGRLVFLVGDVAGKGMGAALLMSSFLASARVLYGSCSDPGELATRLGDIVRANRDPTRFVTGFLGCLDTRTGALHYVNAGHPSALLLRGTETRELASSGIPFGLLDEYRYDAETTEILPGEMLAIFSDGIPEAMRGDEFFGDARLQETLAAAAATPDLDGARRGVFARLDAFLGDAPRSDDITLLLIRRDATLPDTEPVSPRSREIA